MYEESMSQPPQNDLHNLRKTKPHVMLLCGIAENKHIQK